MTRRLDSVLGLDTLPLAELCAARLDGELVRCAGAFLAVDAPDLPEVRAAVAHAGRSTRVIVERRSAAWVLGALPLPPATPQLCVSASARTHRRPSGDLREVRFEPDELVAFGGVLVTGPLRTAIDLVRTASHDEHREDRAALRQLLDMAGMEPVAAAGVLRSRWKLPGKAQAIERLQALASPPRAGQPAETR